MARKVETITTVLDDLTGEPIDAKTKPTEVTYKGKTYSLDLGPQSVQLLEEALNPFISRASGAPALNPDAVRAWAAKNGIKVAPKGKISAAVVEQFNASK